MKNSLIAILLLSLFSEVRAGDEVILYFKEGNYIYVKSCDSKMIVGLSAQDARKNCESKNTRMPVDTFKRLIINSNCDEDASDSEFDRVSEEVDKVVSILADQSKLTTSKSNSFLKEFDFEQKFPCGYKGTVDERIKDCSYQYASKRHGFALVARSSEGKEVYKELSSGLLWSDRLSGKSHQLSADFSCMSSLPEVIGISEVKWKLPTSDQYVEAEKSEIRLALPRMLGDFWTSSKKSDDPKMGLIYRGDSGRIDGVSNKEQAWSRCVGR